MKRGVMLINSRRGTLVDIATAIDGPLAGQIGHLGLNVYEEETELFYGDRSNRLITDEIFSRLLTMPGNAGSHQLVPCSGSATSAQCSATGAQPSPRFGVTLGA